MKVRVTVEIDSAREDAGRLVEEIRSRVSDVPGASIVGAGRAVEVEGITNFQTVGR